MLDKKDKYINGYNRQKNNKYLFVNYTIVKLEKNKLYGTKIIYFT